MYSDITLTNHLQTSSSVNTKSKVIAEWNLNNSETIQAIGNYKNRPMSLSLNANTAPNTTWNANENEATKSTNEWYDYTDYDVVIDGGYTDEAATPVTFRSSRERQKSLMSLEDCFNRFRPRSGINKLRFFGKNKKIIPLTSNNDTFLTPRYYAASKDDKFKYWSSYRTKDNTEYGISLDYINAPGVIHDAAPFVIYKNLIPTNKVVIKVQTNVSNNNSLPTANADPFYSGSTPNYKSTPKIWKVQRYTGTAWTDMYTTTTDVFTEDGYFQLSYGITNAEIISGAYKNNFTIIGTLSSTAALPLIQEPKRIGQAYLVKSSTTDKGTLYIYNGGVSDTILTNYYVIGSVPNPLTYGWYKSEESITNSQQFVTELDKTPGIIPSFVESSVTVYREFEYIKGLRILVTSMLNTNTVFDLIELSPRLEVDITDNVSSFSVKKFASDLGVSNLPVGQLLASTGDITIFDNNQVLNKNNLNSLLNISSTVTLISKSLQIKFYETVLNVPQEFAILSNTPQPTGTTNISITTEGNHGMLSADTVIISGVSPSGYNGTWTAQTGTTGSTLVLNIGSNPGNITTIGTAIKSNPTYKDFHIPVKTMYSDGFPQYNDATRDVSMSLRDLTFYFESFLAPEILLRNVSVSFIVATLLDSIGFSNYKFLRASKSDAVIPYFMVSPDKNIMQVLQDLAVATQTTMFFDEVNNFVVMSKEYLVPPSTSVRNKDINLYGIDSGPRRSNIIEINSESNDIYNDGKIVYYNRYIQKQPNDLQSLSRLDKNQVFEYQRSVLWSLEASEQNLQSRNEEDVTQTAYPLTAIPLAKTLTGTNLPQVIPGTPNRIINNIIEFGDGAYWLGRYAGYFYSNGEIIKYDAIEYSYGSADSTNTVWITSNEEYQYYFSKINKGDKMYKTGNVRIYAEPFYKSDGTYELGAVSKHGRAQFGTTIAEHKVDDGTTTSWWETQRQSLPTNPQKLFKGKDNIATITANKDNIKNKSVTTQTKVKNFLGRQAYSLTSKTKVASESIQSSGLVLTGPTFKEPETEMGAIGYVKKSLASEVDYDTYGARLRLFGDATEDPDFVSLGSSYPAYELGSNLKKFNKDGTYVTGPSKIGAKSGGIAILTNAKGEGYYYELVALEYTRPEVVTTSSTINTLFFYKLKENVNGVLIPTILHEEFRNILVDTGKFTGKVLKTQETDSVYDVGVSVSKTSSSSWVFSLYLDNEQIAIIEDKDPVNSGVAETISLFVRGSSQVMFENTYAMRRFLTKGEMTVLSDKNLTEAEKEKRSKSFANSANVFDDTKVSGISGSKYTLSPLVQTGFLSKLSTSSIPESQIFYEEFGSIMRECAYFNVKFDKAYPALTSLMSPIPASLGGYVVAGYNSTPYRAEFLLFNTTDFVLDLGANKDYLDNVSITGITFTQEAARDLTVDEFLTDKSNYTNQVNYNTVEYKNRYTDIKNNRLLYGSKSFVIDSPYIQTVDLAQNLMNFVINRISKPRKVAAVSVFGMPIIQLGDIVSFVYDTSKTLPNTVSGNNFVVYASEYQREETGPSTILYLSEVL